MSAKSVVWVLCSALLHATWNIAAKRTRKPTAFLFLVTLVSALFALPLLFVIPYRSIPAELAWLTLGSALTHGLSFVTLSLAYETGELSVVYPISRSTPLIVPLLAVPLLGEHITAIGGAGIGLAVLGLWLVQTDGHVRWSSFTQPAAGYAYLMLMLTALFSVIDKRVMQILAKLAWDCPVPASTVFYGLFTAGCALVCMPLALRRVGTTSLRFELRSRGGSITACAVIMWISYVLILEVMRTTAVSYVVAVRQISVLFAVGMAMLTLGERPGPGRLSGAIASVMGVALIAFGS